MNRQAILVTVVTLALVLAGALLLYGVPGSKPDPTHVADKAAKAEKVGKGKGKSKGKAPAAPATPTRVPDEQLVHAHDVPADRPAAPTGAPNVVLVVMSTQRRDQWTAYGGPAEVTPFLGAQATKGAKMDDALSVAVDPHTAEAAIVTGEYPHHVGVMQLGTKKNTRPIAAEANTIGERFAGAGWFTVGLTANHFLNDKVGGAQGFDWYHDAQSFSLMTEQRIDAKDLVDAALNRVAARTDAEKARPMFLQVALVDSHKPIKVPPEEFKPFGGENGDVAPYRATLKRQDDAISKLVEGLGAQGLTPANTVFVVLADHGEGLDMPASARKQHGFVLYRSSVQIPWIWWGKGIPVGKTVGALASEIDLAPTLLAIAGVTGQTGFDGVDLSAAVAGKGGKPARTEAYADTTYEGVHRASLWTATAECQKDFGSIKLDDDQFQTACYDRKADPDFTKAVKNDDLMAKLDKLHGDLMTDVPTANGPDAGDPGEGPAAVPAADAAEGAGDAAGDAADGAGQ